MRVAVLLQRRNIRNPVLGFALSELSSRELDDTRTRRFKIPPPTYDPHPSNRPEGYTSPYRKVSALEKSRGVRASVTADKALSIGPKLPANGQTFERGLIKADSPLCIGDGHV